MRPDRKYLLLTSALLLCFAAEPVDSSTSPAQAQAVSTSTQRYETRADHDPNGTGKFYMGREIAQVMGPGGIAWLDRPDRENQEKSSDIVNALELRSTDVAADLGAGSGYYTFRLAAKISKVFAVDIQDEMIATIRQRAAERKINNVGVIKGAEDDPHLPANSLDLVLMVDVYHELSYPYEVMSHVRQALKSSGRMVFVEYRKEDPKLPIKEVHKMSVDQLEKEMAAVKLVKVKTVETMPLQHIVIFQKQP